TVLVVDDDDSLRMLCRVNLELEGYRVLEAPTVERAVELIGDEDVDVVLLDVHVGSGDGFRVLSVVSDERVALFTGSFEVDEQRSGEVDAVIKKPFTLTDLSETVGRLAAVEPASARFSRPVTVAAVRTPAEYESQLRRYLFDRSEEGRAVRVGEKEVSERAEIVARYRDLFSREQLEALRAAEQDTSDDTDRERLYRLRKTCEAGVVSAELAEREDALENAILAARVEFKGEELPIRS